MFRKPVKWETTVFLNGIAEELYTTLQNLLQSVNLSVASKTPMEYLSAIGTAASSGDNILLTPTSGKYLIIHSIMVQNTSTTTTTAIIKTGSTNRARFTLAQNISGTFTPDNPLRMEVGQTVVLNLSGANSHNYTILYTEG